MTKVKVFPLNLGGTINGIQERIESEANKLLGEHPDLDIKHTAVLPTNSGVSILLVFYTEDKDPKQASKAATSKTKK